VRGAGYALSIEELNTGLSSMAAPVRDHTGTVVAAMTAAGPSFRLTGAHLDRCIALVKQEAEATSRALGSRVSAA
jgi:DNA-binding IclR family transcriptional regulator